ncbi:hypothetical protein Ccrd_008011 [Cynara cardunculus var. scolymus]|uniref:Reverse transcriptase zinc-binding domain-containing protein n=1 Tax=Cynara cardunculus var. scolymus TaxID=59895 RepID=A0A103XFZ2_CYNCS|nr:hypothetical protein Ccrd_008011 [Cynara cardunculus var. scolymus]
MNVVNLTDGFGVGCRVKMGENGVVGKDEINKCIRSLMEGEDGCKMRVKMAQPKEGATMALSQDSSSTRNIIKIHKEFHKLNLPFADWFLKEQRPNGIDFSWRWDLDPHGTFSVSSTRAAYDDRSLDQVSFRTSWWVNWVPAKINILAWRLLHKRLPTKNNLLKRGVICLSSLCPLCDCIEEDEEHLFIGCSISRKLLKDLCTWWKVDIGQVNSIDNLLDRSSEVAGNSMCKKAFLGVVYGFFWIIWNLRNRKIFRASSMNSTSLLAGQLQAYSFSGLKIGFGKAFC